MQNSNKMAELQEKMYSYFQHNPSLKVLFVFDDTLMHEYKDELDSAEWQEGYQYVVFAGDWFATKYKITHEWQNIKTVLLFPDMHEPILQDDMAKFPLLGALKANLAYKKQPFDAFIQQYHIPASMAMFVQKHIEDLQRGSVLRWASAYLSPSFDTNTGMRLLLSAYLDQERLLDMEHILIRIMLLATNSENKRATFFRKLYHPYNRDILDFVHKEFKSLVGQEIIENSAIHVEKIVESLKYNTITQQITVLPADPYKGYKIVNSLSLQRINSLIDTAMNNYRFHDAMLDLFKVVGSNIREGKLIEVYGADAPFHYISADLCMPILENMAIEVQSHPEDVLLRLSPILQQFKEQPDISGIGKFVQHAASYYQQRNAFRSVLLNTPDVYIDTYINSVAPLDMTYRHIVREYYTALQAIEMPEYAEKLKKQIDLDYADFTNDLNLGWMSCIRQSHAGFGAVSVIGHQADFYQKMVKNCETKQVVIVSDAFRYELASELVQLLAAKKHIAKLEAMLASMPTETKYTKLTLFPHTALSFSDLDMAVDGSVRATADARTELLGNYKPNAVCVDYSTVMQQDQRVNRELFKRPLVYIMHNTVDDAGHSNSAIEFTQGCSKAIEELKALILRLHDYYNVVNILVTSDHGFLFQDLAIAEHTKHQITDNAIERKSRYYLTDSKKEIHGIAKFPLQSVSPMQSDQEIFVGVPCGTNRFATQGGGYQFAHGGTALEEVIVPVVICKYQRTNEAKSKVGVALVSRNLSVISSSLKIALVQSEAVDSTHQERTISCALYDGENVVSNIVELTLKSSDEELTASRMFNNTLTLNAVVQSAHLELRIFDKDDQLNPLIQQTVINNTLIERDEF